MRFPEERLSSTNSYRGQVGAGGRGRAADETRSNGPNCPGSLIVVSNRQPYRHEYESDGDGDRSVTVDEPAGGLTAGLDPVVQEASGTWIAWGDGEADFEVADEDHCVEVPPDEEAYTLRRIDLSEEAVESYYYGFSNRVLWPLCHGFTDLVDHRSDDFDWYRTVNERFADAVVEHADDDSIVWLQDYHFALAPRRIRESVAPSTTVAQFWHIPWPTPETFQQCPAAGHVLEGLLGNDLLGFHVGRYADRFLDCVERYLPAAGVDRRERTVRYDGHETQVVATPMGVDAERYDRDARAVDRSQLAAVRDEFGIPDDTVLGLGVDRLDYAKGIPERFAALERFFERNPDWRGEFTFVQKATPSRTDIPAYRRYGEHVRGEAERINRRFGTGDWQPIVYTEDYVEHENLCALYRYADVMIVSSLADGMNLVAQEYVAANVDGDGALLLSDRTGAHERLGPHALTIDPTDADETAAQLERALSMPTRERRQRMGTLRTRVFDHDLEQWMDTQFDWIRSIHGNRETDASDADEADDERDPRERTPTA